MRSNRKTKPTHLVNNEENMQIRSNGKKISGHSFIHWIEFNTLLNVNREEKSIYTKYAY